MKFYLDFKSDNFGKKRIDEPFGVDGIDFSLKQKSNGMGRDISFSGGEIQFEFTNMRDHYLKELLYYNRTFGFEAIVVLTIEIDKNNSYKCDLDFATATTDDLEYFKCKGIEDGKLQIVKARKSVKVDLLSNKDIDGNYITPLVPENILLLAKPVVQTSKWEQVQPYNFRILAEYDDDRSTVYAQINPSSSLITYTLEDSFTFFETQTLEFGNEFNQSQFLNLTAKNSLKNIKIKISNLDLNFNTDVDNGGNGYAEMRLTVAYGVDFNTAIKKILLETVKSEHESYLFKGDLNLTIDSLNRGDNIWIYLAFKVRQSAYNPPIIVRRFEVFLNILTMKTEITAESTAYNSISKSIRLVDVIRQVVRSISGLEINAPRFDVGGQFYDNRLVNGNFLRNIINRQFSVSLEDIEKSITEMRGDWEIGSDGKVFFGIEQDFYKPIESGFFNDTQFSKMNKTFNEKYKVNEFYYKYNKFQSLKENEEPNSADTIHGESKLVFFNKNVENKKEVEIQWIRDAFLIEATRRKAIEITQETASQDDDDLFCIDTINTTFNNTFTETSNLQHSFDNTTSKLTIKNDGTVNFISLGISVNSIFIIQPIDINSGTYSVFSVENNTLILTKLSGINSSLGNGIRQTKYTYELSQLFVPFTNYTNQGFSETENLNAAENYSNRRYSIARNVYNYYQSYLATCNLYWKNNPLKNTWYKNNGKYTAKFNGIKLKENADLIPLNPILSPVMYNEIVFANVDFADYITLQNNIRSSRGFIRTIDNNNQVVKVYPIDMEYQLLEKELRIKAEEKYEPTRMTINKTQYFIEINNETKVDSLLYDFDFEKLYIYDKNRFRLYNGVYWNEVTVNGATANSIVQLKEWLDLL
jgi:hypothetical protein